MFAEMGFNIIPDIAEIDKVKEESNLLLPIDNLVSYSISIRTVACFFVAGLEIPHERLNHCFFALCC